MSAQNSLRQVAYVAETVFNTVPSTPATQLVEFTGYEATLNTEQLNSNNINPTRQVTFSRRGNVGVEGTLSVELCPDNYDWVLENLFRSTFNTNVLKPGNTQTSYTIEEGFTDIGQYQVVSGVRFNTMALNITTDALVTAEFGFMGAGAAALTGTSIDATPTGITQKNSFFHEGSTISEGGSAIAYVSSITMNVTNNMTGNYALSSTSYRSMSDGKFEVTGELTAMFESNALYNKFRNSTSSSLSVVLVAGAETLTINVPNLVYTAGNFDTGTDGPVTVTLGFTGVYSTGDAASIVVTRS